MGLTKPAQTFFYQKDIIDLSNNLHYPVLMGGAIQSYGSCCTMWGPPVISLVYKPP